MRPLTPQLCTGKVFHRRLVPTLHQFTYPISYVLFDPDWPQDLTGAHPLWSTGRWSPGQVRADDYGGEESSAGGVSLGDDIRRQLVELGTWPAGAADPGPVRLLTQPRRWGWLFNPISIFFAWTDNKTPSVSPDSFETDRGPVGVVLEVTNTPWKERHRYPMTLQQTDVSGDGRPRLAAEFDKVLHVSPFLHEDYRYRLTIDWDDNPSGKQPHNQSGRLGVGIDVLSDDGSVMVETKMDLAVESADRQALGRSLRRDGFPTHRTSFGIHRQAASLARKRVPFVAHPKSRKPASNPERAAVVKGGKHD